MKPRRPRRERVGGRSRDPQGLAPSKSAPTGSFSVRPSSFQAGRPTICRSKRPGTQQRRIRERPGGSSPRSRMIVVLFHLETVHLDEQLVKRLLALIPVPSTNPGATVPSRRRRSRRQRRCKGRGLSFNLLEQNHAPAKAPNTHKHLDEIQTRNREKRHPRLTRNRTSANNVFPVPGGPIQQHTLRDPRPPAPETSSGTRETP